MKTDVLIAGTGIAGLSLAIRLSQLAPKVAILLITKTSATENNSVMAQGGIALSAQADINSHINDTIAAGFPLCRIDAVKEVVHAGSDVLYHLKKCGVEFDLTTGGQFDLVLEGGHTAKRILHKGDQTGKEIHQKLLAIVQGLSQVKILENTMGVDLLLEGEGNGRTCAGMMVWSALGGYSAISAHATVLASGGWGQVYENTTNHANATGDGLAMALRAGAKIGHMEFTQFHPTALFEPKKSRKELITEALRGAGAFLRSKKGEIFMHQYHKRADLATRDIVTRAVINEMQKCGSDHVYLDCRHLEPEILCGKFRHVLESCKKAGFDPNISLIPVAPAAHFACGGIITDLGARTSIDSLYAIGECADTGLHGANRLASNSLLEAIAMPLRCSVQLVALLKKRGKCQEYAGHFPKPALVAANREEQLRKRLRLLMWRKAGAVTSNVLLSAALDELRVMEAGNPKSGTGNKAALEFRNMLDTSIEIVSQSLKRNRNAGVFFNCDLSEANDQASSFFSNDDMYLPSA